MRSRTASVLWRVHVGQHPWAGMVLRSDANACIPSARALSTVTSTTTSIARGTSIPSLQSLMLHPHAPTTPCVLGWVRTFASLPSHRVLEMPALSPTMSQGNIAAWKKSEGQEIAAGDVLAEVETDKATIDWESMDDGVLAKILVPQGTKDVAVGTPVAIVVEEASDAAAFADYQPGAAAPSTPSPPPTTSSTPPSSSSSTSYPPHVVMGMPALSPTMAQGNVAAFRKQVGEEVAAGDSLAEIETDKATMEWESQDDGYVAKWLVDQGAKDVAVGTPVLVMVDNKEDVAAFDSFTPDTTAATPPPAAAKPAAQPTTPPPPPPPTPRQAAPTTPPRTPSGRVVASPYAKKLALEAGVSIVGVAGTGPNGRIVAEDVQRLIASGGGGPAAAVAAGAGPDGAAPGAPYVDIVNSQIRKVTAARLLESKQQVPHYYLTVDVRMDTLMKLRGQLNEQLAASGAKLSVNDFVIKAAAMACKKVPEANSAWMGDFIRQYNTVDCSVAVQTPVGLMVPIVKNADSKGLVAISTDVKSLAAKAKEGKLQPSEYQGGTFTISNLGMMGIDQFAAIINPPQACILAVGTTNTRVVLDKQGVPSNASFMSVTLSADHRVADGAVGAEWLKAFKGYIENPVTMLL